MKKYFKTKKEATKALNERKILNGSLQVFRMPKGSRKAGYFAVCDYTEYLNTY